MGPDCSLGNKRTKIHKPRRPKSEVRGVMRLEYSMNLKSLPSFDQFVPTNDDLSKVFDTIVSSAVDKTCAPPIAMEEEESLLLEGLPPNPLPGDKTEARSDADDDDNDDINETTVTDQPDVVLENRFYKLSRNKIWQERYFIFSSDGLLTYYHKKGDQTPRASYQVTRHSGCQVSDLFVEQIQNGTKMASLYCITFTWPEDAPSRDSSFPTRQLNDSFRDDTSINIGIEGSPTSPPISVTGGEKKATKALPSFKSPFARKSKKSSSSRNRTRSLSPKSKSVSEGGGSKKHSAYDFRHSSSMNWIKKRSASADSSLESPTDNNSKQQKKKTKKFSKHRGHSSMSGIVGMEITPPIFQEYETILEGGGDKGECRVEITGSKDLNSSIAIMSENGGSFASAANDDPQVVSPVSSVGVTENQNQLSTYQNQHNSEQAELLHAYYGEQKAKLKEKRKELIQATKVGVAATAALGVGVVTAGVGLAAGLVVLGAAAAAGGTAGVAEAGLKKFQQRSGKLTIATTSYEKAKLWKSSVDACLESDTVVQSTWGQMFVAEGRKKTSMLVPHDVALLNVGKRGGNADNMSADGDFHVKSLELPSGQSALFMRDRNFLVEEGARWRPLEGGWVSFLGPGAQSLRIFSEERVHSQQSDSKKVAKLAVGASTSSPLKTQLVVKSNALDAFMCAMSYAKIAPTDGEEGEFLVPNSGQSASFRLLEKMNEHTDIIHLVCRKLYLFPSWTEPRDFVLFRYWRYEPDGSYFVCYESVEHPSCPAQHGYVRGEMHQACTFAPRKDFDKKKKSTMNGTAECLVTVFTQVDPKGWVPTKHLPFLSNQSYADAFGISALLQILDVRDAIERDRFLDIGQEIHHQESSRVRSKQSGRHQKGASASGGDELSYDLRFKNRERCDSITMDTLSGFETHPPCFTYDSWAEPDANSFMVRGPTYKKDKIKINAGSSVGRLVAVDLVEVDEPIYKGMAAHPSERIQRALKREKKLKEEGKESDLPPFLVVVNILIPGPPFYHLVLYYAVDDMRTIDGSDGTPFSKLCKKFMFGESDDFRDKTFKLIPQIVEGNFVVRKAVGSTPAIMGRKLRQLYSRTDRYLELILDCASSQVATGVIKLSLGYAKTLMVDMGFVLEGDEEEYLPERIFGCCRLKYIDFAKKLRKVEPY